MRDWLSHRARATPGAVAEIEADDGTVHSYADLDERVEERAGRLAALDVGVGDHVGVALGTRPAFVDLVHAAMRVGAVLVPLDARLTANELAERVERVDLDLLVCGRDTEGIARGAVGRNDGGDDGRGDDRAAGRAGGSAGRAGGPDGRADGSAGDTAAIPIVSVDRPENGGAGAIIALDEVDPRTYDLPAWGWEDTQVIAFTSGTTGRPKAVALTTGNLFSSACSSAFRLGVRRSDRWHCCMPMYHVGGLSPVYRSVVYGTAVVVQAGFEAEATLAAMAEHDVTCISLVPTMLRRVLDAGDPPDSLRLVLLGGGPIPEELVARCEERTVPVCPTYGTTETASQVATARPQTAFDHPGTVGYPLLFTEVTVVGDSGTEQPPGEPGEIVVSGPTVMRGYYDDPEATDRAVGQDGFHTGDVGYVDEDDRLYPLDRLDDRIVTGGETVDPGEVATVLRAHEDVRDAAVVGLDDPEWGERVSALVATEAELTRERVDAHCRNRLAGYKRPRTVAFAEELPRTASGTVDREAVRDALRDSSREGRSG